LLLPELHDWEKLSYTLNIGWSHKSSSSPTKRNKQTFSQNFLPWFYICRWRNFSRVENRKRSGIHNEEFHSWICSACL